jgi:hypothetical protein
VGEVEGDIGLETPDDVDATVVGRLTGYTPGRLCADTADGRRRLAKVQ